MSVTELAAQLPPSPVLPEPERVAWVVVRYETVYSTYEVDHTGPGFRVRRMSSLHEPTPKQGEDGQWKDAVDVKRFPDGRLLFCWSADALDATISSPVLSCRPLTTEEVLAGLPEVGR